MKNTIAGASLIFASAVCVVAFAFSVRYHPVIDTKDIIIAIAWAIYVFAGLCFFCYAIAEEKEK